MYIAPSPWISTNVYNFELPTSRAYISNAFTHTLYWLEKESSDLWYVILKTNSLDKVLEYAQNRGLSCEVEEFLNYLKQIDVISFDKDITSGCIHYEKVNINNQSNDFLQKWTELNIKEKKLSHIQFDMTYKCNELCIHCFEDKNNQNIQLDFDNAKKIIDDAYELGLTAVTLSGGECTLCSDFLKIAKYIRKKRIELIIFTNGQSLYDNQDLFEKIIELYPFSIGLSLYSMDSKVHDRITGIKGSWDKTFYIINRLEEKHIPIEIKCFLTKYNADSYKDLIIFTKEHNFKFSLDECLIINQENKNLHTKLTDSQLKVLYKDLYNEKVLNYKHKIDNAWLEEFPCNAGRTLLNIKPNLDVSTCSESKIVFGNLSKSSLKQIWSEQNEVLSNWRLMNRKKISDNCFQHEYCEYCNFCAVKALNEYNKVETLCRNAMIKMDVYKSNAC